MGMFCPQPSQMPNWPSRIRSKAYSMRVSSRLSTSANCELISSWTESSAASTTSPEVCAEFLEQTQVAGQSLAQRVASLDEDLAHVQDRVFAAHWVTSLSDPGRAEGLPPFRVAVPNPLLKRIVCSGLVSPAEALGPRLASNQNIVRKPTAVGRNLRDIPSADRRDTWPENPFPPPPSCEAGAALGPAPLSDNRQNRQRYTAVFRQSIAVRLGGPPGVLTFLPA